LNSLYGIKMTKPAMALREYLRALTSALCGEHETLSQMKKMGMAVPQAAHQIPVYVGTASQKCLEVTGELADGCFTSQCAPHGLQEVKEHFSRGAQRIGRSLADLPLAPLVHCCVEADRGVALRAVRRVLAAYGQRPLYNRFLARQGFVTEAEQIATAAVKGDMAAAATAVSETMAEQVAALGTTQHCRKKVEEFEQAGASYVVLFPMAIDGDYDRGVRSVLAAFAQ